MNTAAPRIAVLPASPAWRTIDFISDLHLHAGDAATFEAWQNYLTNTPADAVFILGDLFEVWVGDDGFSRQPPTGTTCFSCTATAISS
jgi:UDP-2,3-diacylglucosamine hydrolase